MCLGSAPTSLMCSLGCPGEGEREQTTTGWAPTTMIIIINKKKHPLGQALCYILDTDALISPSGVVALLSRWDTASQSGSVVGPRSHSQRTHTQAKTVR